MRRCRLGWHSGTLVYSVMSWKAGWRTVRPTKLSHIACPFSDGYPLQIAAALAQASFSAPHGSPEKR